MQMQTASPQSETIAIMQFLVSNKYSYLATVSVLGNLGDFRTGIQLINFLMTPFY